MIDEIFPYVKILYILKMERENSQSVDFFYFFTIYLFNL